MDEDTFTFCALVSPETFETEHYVYAELKLNDVGNDKSWFAAPIMTGRTAATSQHALDLTTKEQSDAQATQHWHHRVNIDEANLGVATYLWSYVCFAPPPPRQQWVYGVVLEYFWRGGSGDLLVQSQYGRYVISVQDPTLHVVSLAGYALRPFNRMPALHTEVAAVQATTDMLVARFLTGPRYAALNIADVPLACAPPPLGGTCLACILSDESQCGMTVNAILNFAHNQYHDFGKENARALQRPIYFALGTSPARYYVVFLPYVSTVWFF